MTDRPNHRAEAEYLLFDADVRAAQAGEPTLGELSSLAYSAVHALLAIHDTLTSADRYAANEARQREEAEPEMSEAAEWLSRGGSDPLDESDHRDRLDAGGTRWTRAADECWSNGAHHVLELISLPGPLTFASEAECSRCGEIYPGTAEATMEHHRACTGETPENPMGDPLDEDDHRDRIDGDGGRITRKGPRHWHTPIFRTVNCDDDCGRPSLRDWDRRFGPLTFAPEPPPEATDGDLSASEGESGSVEGGEGGDAQEAILCPECGHDIDRHAYDDDRAVDLCGECPDAERCPTPLPSQVARALIEQAMEQAGGRRG